ncbi:MAG: hypothetical protein F4Z45_09985 [Gammaproteobacteria bacterium]|nr:hypothetical protein [Gammaproteobacteria bacterium]
MARAFWRRAAVAPVPGRQAARGRGARMIVAAFYRFVSLERLEALRSRFEALAAGLGLKGTILLAEEGINGGLCGARKALDAFMAALGEDQRFAGMPVRLSTAAPGNPVFQRLKVRIKPEIVSLGRPEADPLKATGQRVAPADWNALLDRSDVQVVDVRNAYETAIGGFPGALDPDTERFRDFPAFVEEALNPDAHREVALYCTGGIRCEKASAYLLSLGFETVHQLDGGVLNYLASVSAQESRWRGDCFVFDQRVAVDGQLREAETDSPLGAINRSTAA